MPLYHKMEIAGLQRELPLCPINENLYIGAFIMFGDPELTVAAATKLLELAPEFDYIVTPEAKSIPLAHEMAKQCGNSYYIVVRKKPKLYMTDIFEVTVRSITTEGEQKLFLDKKDADLMKNKRILIIDDVISTGESLAATEELVKKAGGIIVGKAAVLAEGEAADRKDIIYLNKLPLFTPDGKVLD